MTFYKFKGLDEEQQLEVIFANAVQVAERKDESASYVLYQLNNFYVELSLLNNAPQPVIKTFTTTNLLEPYLKDVSINF